MGVPTCPPLIGRKLTKRLRGYPVPTPVVAPLLAHEALKCPRRIGFRLFGVQPDIRYTQAELARFEEGDFVDNTAAEVLVAERNARIQVPFSWLPLLALKGKADGGYRDSMGLKVVVETKSINEKGFSRAVGSWQNVPAAPKVEWLVQAGLAACSPTIAADLLHVVLVDNERYETAEWLLGLNEPLELPDVAAEVDGETGEIVRPTIRRLVMGEVWRLAEVLATCERGALPARVVPGFGLVLIPPAADEDRAEPWQCRFCPFQPTCARLPADEVPDFGEIAA